MQLIINRLIGQHFKVITNWILPHFRFTNGKRLIELHSRPELKSPPRDDRPHSKTRSPFSQNKTVLLMLFAVHFSPSQLCNQRTRRSLLGLFSPLKVLEVGRSRLELGSWLSHTQHQCDWHNLWKCFSINFQLSWIYFDGTHSHEEEVSSFHSKVNRMIHVTFELQEFLLRIVEK